MHGLVVAHGLFKVKRILFINGRGERGVGLLGTLPRGAFIVQMTGAALLDKFKILPGFREGLPRCDLFRLFKGLASLTVDLAVVSASSMAGFATDTDKEFVGVRRFIPSLRPEPGHMTADTILVLCVVLLRVEFRLDHGCILFFIPVGFERVDCFRVGSLYP